MLGLGLFEFARLFASGAGVANETEPEFATYRSIAGSFGTAGPGHNLGLRIEIL